MIVYGTGGGQTVLGQMGQNKCPACEQESTFSARVEYRYFHIWFLFSFLIGRDYYIVCDQCETRAAMDRAELRTKFPRDNIPLIRKWGWLLCLGIAAVIIGGVAIRDQAREMEIAAWIDAPRVEDIYLADVAQIEDSGYGLENPLVKSGAKVYGAMKLSLIEGEDLSFVISLRAYGGVKSLRRELSKGVSVGYDVDNPVVLTRDKIKTLRERGIIVDVVRKG